MGEVWALRLDLASANVLAWVARRGRNAELTPETRYYIADRYRRLADHHRRRGHHTRARRLYAKAKSFYDSGGGPPYAAAMAMPRPARWIRTDAVSSASLSDPDDAA
jgi:hypothetical protein